MKTYNGREGVLVRAREERKQRNPPLPEKRPPTVHRRNRYRLRTYLGGLAIRARLRACGRIRIQPGVELVRRPDGSAGYRGLVTCSSVWACPVCAARVCAGRADELAHAVAWGAENGLDAFLVTATVRHAWTDSAARTIAGVADAWRRLVRGAPWRRFLARAGVRHWVRGMELTHGANGWHPHLHVLMLVDRNARTSHREWSEPTILAEDADGWLCDRWRECVVRELGADCAPSEAHGFDVRPAHVASYVAKLGLELAGADTKRAASGSRTPWQIAYDAMRERRPRDVELWREYTDATHGHRQLTWSRGLRAAVGLDDDETDAELLAREDELARRIAMIDADTWRDVRDRAVELLELAELGADELAIWRAARRIQSDRWACAPP